MSKFKSYGPPTLFFEMSRGCVRSTASRALDIKNYIRANEFYTRSDMRMKNNVEDLGEENILKLKQIIQNPARLKMLNTQVYITWINHSLSNQKKHIF